MLFFTRMSDSYIFLKFMIEEACKTKQHLDYLPSTGINRDNGRLYFETVI